MDIRYSINSTGTFYMSDTEVDEEIRCLQNCKTVEDSFYRNWIIKNRMHWKECIQYLGTFYFIPDEIPQKPPVPRKEREVKPLTYSLHNLVQRALEQA